MYYKLLVLVLFFSFLSFNNRLSAQVTGPHREVGLSFSNINFNGDAAFSAFYKKELKENVYRRLRFFYGDIGTSFMDNWASFSFGAGIAIGREKRKTLDSKLSFYQGPELGASLFANGASRANTSLGVSGSFNWVLGLQHSFNDRWAVNVETIPGFNINVTGGEEQNTIVGVSAGFRNTVLLGLVRKF